MAPRGENRPESGAGKMSIVSVKRSDQRIEGRPRNPAASLCTRRRQAARTTEAGTCLTCARHPPAPACVDKPFETVRAPFGTYCRKFEDRFTGFTGFIPISALALIPPHRSFKVPWIPKCCSAAMALRANCRHSARLSDATGTGVTFNPGLSTGRAAVPCILKGRASAHDGLPIPCQSIADISARLAHPL
jgi:hypothetical protein